MRFINLILSNFIGQLTTSMVEVHLLLSNYLVHTCTVHCMKLTQCVVN